MCYYIRHGQYTGDKNDDYDDVDKDYAIYNTFMTKYTVTFT